MRSELQIARRLYFGLERNGGRRMSRPAVRVALLGIIIGMAVMIVSIFVVIGFKQEITRKVVGFGGHIRVVNFDNNNTYEMQPVRVGDTLLAQLQGLEGVESAWRFCTKPGMLKTQDAFQAVIYKGLPLDDNSAWAFFRRNLTEGRLPRQAGEVIVSASVARLMQLPLDTTVLCYFIQDNVRARRLHICGFYETGFSDYDNLFMAGDLGAVQQLNGWDTQQVSGVELDIRNFRRLEEVTERVYFLTANRSDDDGNFFYTQNVVQLNPAVFSWLDLLDMNVVVIILLMLAVSGFSIVSGLLILILDSIRLIGTLKALGAANGYIRRIFLAEAAMLVGRGMLWGNVVGLGLCALQYGLHIVPLDAAAYYVDYVPICFHWGWWLVLNVGTLLVSLLVLLAPSGIVSRISPAKVMHFE